MCQVRVVAATRLWSCPVTSTDVRTDVVIDDPRNSILLEVYGAELVPTTQFSSKHTLRFPRVECVRTDKVTLW